jgi:hypothetical protein
MFENALLEMKFTRYFPIYQRSSIIKNISNTDPYGSSFVSDKTGWIKSF